MVEAIGIAVIVALSWVLAFGMATEIDAEKRRRSMISGATPEKSETRGKRAA